MSKHFTDDGNGDDDEDGRRLLFSSFKRRRCLLLLFKYSFFFSKLIFHDVYAINEHEKRYSTYKIGDNVCLSFVVISRNE